MISFWFLPASALFSSGDAGLQKTRSGNEAGPANARSIDKISESYAATGLATQGSAWLNLTKWGRLYQALDKFRVVIPFAVKTTPRIVGRGGCGC